MDENGDVRKGRQGAVDSPELQAAREQWSRKMRAFQRGARAELSGRVVSREEVTAFVKKGRSNTTD